jgi:hypothetical protein
MTPEVVGLMITVTVKHGSENKQEAPNEIHTYHCQKFHIHMHQQSAAV